MGQRQKAIRTGKPPDQPGLLTPQERQRLDDDGFLAFAGLVDLKRVAAMRARLEELLLATPQEHAGTLIVGGLLEEALFDAAWLHSRVLAAARHLLGEELRLTGATSRGIRPGHGQQALHVDWGGQGIPNVWYACHAICALVDFTEQNGATRVIPGSHRNPWMIRKQHDPRGPHPGQRQLVGPAGTVFVLNIHCYHSAMHNASGEPRLAIFSHFTRRDSPLYQEAPPAEPSGAVLARQAPEIQALLRG
jgi:hypothetical protein